MTSSLAEQASCKSATATTGAPELNLAYTWLRWRCSGRHGISIRTKRDRPCWVWLTFGKVLPPLFPHVHPHNTSVASAAVQLRCLLEQSRVHTWIQPVPLKRFEFCPEWHACETVLLFVAGKKKHLNFKSQWKDLLRHHSFVLPQKYDMDWINCWRRMIAAVVPPVRIRIKSGAKSAAMKGPSFFLFWLTRMAQKSSIGLYTEVRSDWERTFEK